MSLRKAVVLLACAAAADASGAIDWTPERFGPLDRPPALRPVGEPATVVTREAFLREVPRADAAALDAAWAALDAGRLREAEAAFGGLPADGRAGVGRALTSTLLGEGDAALERWITLLRHEPEALAYVNLGWDTRVRVARARVLLHAGLAVDARPAEPLFLMAVCDVLLRDFPLAGQHLRQARVRAGAGPHLLTLGDVVDSLDGGTLAAWVAARNPPAAPTPLPRPTTPESAPPAASAAVPAIGPSKPRAPEPAAPAEAPDLAALVTRLREAATAVARFELRLNEKLYPLIVLPTEPESADRKP